MGNIKYYPIDAYYSFLDKQLHYIVKQVNGDGTSIKLANTKKDPEITVSLSQVIYS